MAAFQTAIVVVLLSWFALKVSKQGFLRAASYVVLMYLYGPYFLSVIDFIGNRQGAVGVVLLAITASLLLLIVGVWAVSREGDVGTAGLSLMFVASWLSSLTILLFLFGRTIGGYVWWDVLLEWDIWHVTLPHTIPHVTYVIGTLCLAYLLHRYLQQRQGGRLRGTLDEDSIMHVSDAPSGLAAFQRGRKPLDRKIALSLFGLALTIPTIILPGWKWWLANVIM